MPLTVRAATPADRSFVIGLAGRLANFDPAPWRTRDELIAGDRRALEGWFDSPVDGEAMLLAELDGTACGCAYLMVATDYFSGRRHAHLSVLAVAEGFEGRGVGTALLDACDAWARECGADRVTLHVMANNTRARTLYERRGFAAEYLRYVKPLG